MKKTQEDDILWKMLATELGVPEIREMQEYLRGEGKHYDMGYGGLTVEPYDAHGGHSRMFRVRHDRFGEVMLSRSALQSILYDLLHSLRRKGGTSGDSFN